MTVEELLASKATLERIISALQGQMDEIDIELKNFGPKKT